MKLLNCALAGIIFTLSWYTQGEELKKCKVYSNSLETVNINVIVFINDHLLGYHGMDWVKYQDGEVIDSVKVFYSPGNFSVNKRKYERFISKECDSAIVRFRISSMEDVVHHRERFSFNFNFNPELDNVNEANIIRFEELELKKYRKKWGIKCKRGTVLIYKHGQNMVPYFGKIMCKDERLRIMSR